MFQKLRVLKQEQRRLKRAPQLNATQKETLFQRTFGGMELVELLPMKRRSYLHMMAIIPALRVMHWDLTGTVLWLKFQVRLIYEFTQNQWRCWT